jgi:hypothetical protein
MLDHIIYCCLTKYVQLEIWFYSVFEIISALFPRKETDFFCADACFKRMTRIDLANDFIFSTEWDWWNSEWFRLLMHLIHNVCVRALYYFFIWCWIIVCSTCACRVLNIINSKQIYDRKIKWNTKHFFKSLSNTALDTLSIKITKTQDLYGFKNVIVDHLR